MHSRNRAKNTVFCEEFLDVRWLLIATYVSLQNYQSAAHENADRTTKGSIE